MPFATLQGKNESFMPIGILSVGYDKTDVWFVLCWAVSVLPVMVALVYVAKEREAQVILLNIALENDEFVVITGDYVSNFV